MLRCLFALTAVLLVASASSATTWTIKPDGTGDAPTIQAAMDWSSPGDLILLECGTYYEHHIGVRSGIHLRSVTGQPDCAVIDAQGYTQALGCSSLDLATTIEGITIQGASLGALGISYSFPAVLNCSFTNNSGYAGGAVTCTFSDPAFHGCTFTDNVAAGGGAIAAWESQILLDHCTFERNRAVAVSESTGSGGALSLGSCTVTLADCDFTDNEADTSGGGIVAQWTEIDMDDCTFTANVAHDQGGGGMTAAQCWLLIDNCSFTSNVADSTNGAGGGLYNWLSHVRIRDCSFVGNSAWRGGGLRLGACWPIEEEGVTRCQFVDNTVGLSVSSGSSMVVDGCLFDGNSATALTCVQSDLIVAHSTFHGTSATAGGAVRSINGGNLSLDRCIIAFSSSGSAVSCATEGTIELLCCDLYGNAGGDWVDCAAGQETVNGNIWADPLFCDAPAGDFHLASNSQCADAPGCGLIGAYPVGCPPASNVAQSQPRNAARLLGPCMPNPIVEPARIVYRVPGGTTPSGVRLTIYSADGRLVRRLVNTELPGGRYEVVWDRRGAAGEPVPSGVYFGRLEAGGQTSSMSLVVLR